MTGDERMGWRRARRKQSNKITPRISFFMPTTARLSLYINTLGQVLTTHTTPHNVHFLIFLFLSFFPFVILYEQAATEGTEGRDCGGKLRYWETIMMAGYRRNTPFSTYNRFVSITVGFYLLRGEWGDGFGGGLHKIWGKFFLSDIQLYTYIIIQRGRFKTLLHDSEARHSPGSSTYT